MPLNKVFSDATAALEGVLQDGMTIMCGGFGLCGIPENLIAAVRRSGARDLTFVSNNGGTSDFGLGLLMETGQVRKMIASFLGGNKLFERLVLDGSVELQLVPQGSLMEKIRCGGAGLAGFYTPTGVGTLLEKDREIREFDGRKYMFERALRGDLAFVKAWKGDPMGNLTYRKSARNDNPEMATAADVVIAEVEHLVAVGDLDPDCVHTPGIYVNRVFQGVSYEKRVEQRTTTPRIDRPVAIAQVEVRTGAPIADASPLAKVVSITAE